MRAHIVLNKLIEKLLLLSKKRQLLNYKRRLLFNQKKNNNDKHHWLEPQIIPFLSMGCSCCTSFLQVLVSLKEKNSKIIVSNFKNFLFHSVLRCRFICNFFSVIYAYIINDTKCERKKMKKYSALMRRSSLLSFPIELKSDR